MRFEEKWERRSPWWSLILKCGEPSRGFSRSGAMIDKIKD
jgi:hypothetical protein